MLSQCRQLHVPRTPGRSPKLKGAGAEPKEKPPAAGADVLAAAPDAEPNAGAAALPKEKGAAVAAEAEVLLLPPKLKGLGAGAASASLSFSLSASLLPAAGCAAKPKKLEEGALPPAASRQQWVQVGCCDTVTVQHLVPEVHVACHIAAATAGLALGRKARPMHAWGASSWLCHVHGQASVPLCSPSAPLLLSFGGSPNAGAFVPVPLLPNADELPKTDLAAAAAAPTPSWPAQHETGL